MNKQSLKQGVAFNLLRTITITFLSFVSFPFATSALGDIAMGEYAFANTFVYFFLIIAKLGIPTIAIRECAKVRDDKEDLNNKVQTFFLLQLITTLISYGLLIIIVFGLNDIAFTSLSRDLIMLLSLNFLIGVFSFEWVYIALEKHFYIAFRSVVTSVIGILLVITFVKSDRNLFTYAFLAMLTTFVTAGANVFMLKKEGISLLPKKKLDLKSNVKPLYIIFLITLLVTIYNQGDSILLGYLGETKSEVGSYAVGVRGIEIVITIITSLSAVFIPRASIAIKNNNDQEFKSITNYSMNITLFIGLPAVIALLVLSKEFVNFSISSQIYWDYLAVNNAVLATALLASMMITYSISDNIYQQILVPLKKEKWYFYTLVFAIIIDFALALLFALVLFKDNVLLGVSLATIITDVLVLIVMIFISRKWTSKSIFNLNSLKIVVATVLTGLLIFFTKDYINIANYLTKIAVIIGYSGIFYLSVLFVTKENLVRDIFNTIK